MPAVYLSPPAVSSRLPPETMIFYSTAVSSSSFPPSSSPRTSLLSPVESNPSKVSAVFCLPSGLTVCTWGRDCPSPPLSDKQLTRQPPGPRQKIWGCRMTQLTPVTFSVSSSLTSCVSSIFFLRNKFPYKVWYHRNTNRLYLPNQPREDQCGDWLPPGVWPFHLCPGHLSEAHKDDAGPKLFVLGPTHWILFRFPQTDFQMCILAPPPRLLLASIWKIVWDICCSFLG